MTNIPAPGTPSAAAAPGAGLLAQNTLKATGATKEARFLLGLLQEGFGLQNNLIEQRVMLKAAGQGVDAWHLDAERKTLYLLSAKLSDDPAALKPALRGVSLAIDRIFGDEAEHAAVEPGDEFLAALRAHVLENRFLVGQVFVQLYFSGDPADARKSELLGALVEELSGKKYLIDDFCGGQNAVLSVEFRSSTSQEVAIASQGRRTHRYPIDLSRTIQLDSPAGETLTAGYLRLADLLTIYQKMGQRFLSRNIRSGLGVEHPTHRAIMKSFEDIVINQKMTPEEFSFLHNGVSIAVEAYENRKGQVMVTEPRLLNGAQTVASLSAFVDKWAGQDKFERNRDLLDRIRVLGRVVSGATADFVSQVTIANNRQNPVEPWNLRANDLIQLEFQEKFAKEAGLYYERQQGAFASLTEPELEALGAQPGRPVEMRRLAQTFLALQGEIDRLSRLRLVFESESVYRDVFRESYLKKDVRRMVLAYKVLMRTLAVARDIMDRFTEKYHWLPKATGLLGSLLIQALLNDEKAEEYIQAYGTSLKIENDFVELLKDLASRKVRPLLAAYIAGPREAEMLQTMNFTFLRTKGAFQKCMELGAEKHGWKKLGL